MSFAIFEVLYLIDLVEANLIFGMYELQSNDMKASWSNLEQRRRNNELQSVIHILTMHVPSYFIFERLLRVILIEMRQDTLDATINSS